MRFTEIISESSKICPQCGMKGCTCAPGKCKCKPKPGYPKQMDEAANPAQQAAIAIAKKKKQGVAEGLSQTLRKFVPGYAKREIDKKMDAGKFGKTDADKDANFQRYKKIQDKLKEQGVAEGENWSKHNNPRAGGMSKKSVSSYRRSHPGSKIQTAVTTKPSKLKKGSKAAKRRASFCARMRGMKKHRTSAKTAHDPNSNINKSLRRWHCESIEELHELVMLAEQFIRNNKK